MHIADPGCLDEQDLGHLAPNRKIYSIGENTNPDTMKWNVIALTLIAAFSLMLVSMIGLVVAQEETGDPQLSYKQPTLYMKSDADDENGRQWMDADPDMNGSVASHTSINTVGSGTKGETYTQDPALDHTLYLDPAAGNIVIHLHMERQDSGAHDTTVHFQMSAGNIAVDEEVSSSDDANWHLEANLSEDQTEIPADTTITFSWDYNFQGSGQYTMYCDGSSYITFPVAKDTDNDGTPDTIDDDDDGDGYSDEKEISAGTDPLDANSYPSGSSGGGSDDESDNPLPGFESLIVLAAAPVAIIAFRRRF